KPAKPKLSATAGLPEAAAKAASVPPPLPLSSTGSFRPSSAYTVCARRASARDASVATSGARRRSKPASTCASGIRCFFTRSRKRFSMTSKSAMRLTRTSAEAVASSGMTLRVWPPLASVQLNLMRLPASDRSLVCRIWCASSTIAFRPSSGFTPACADLPRTVSVAWPPSERAARIHRVHVRDQHDPPRPAALKPPDHHLADVLRRVEEAIGVCGARLVELDLASERAEPLAEVRRQTIEPLLVAAPR